MKQLIVLLGVVGVSLSAVFVRLSDAPSLFLTLWRMAFSTVLLTPVILFRFRKELTGLDRKDIFLSILSGFFLGLHFTAYFEALRFLPIASAVVLVDTEVIFIAFASKFILHKPLSKTAWAAVLLAFAGSVVVSSVNSSQGKTSMRGVFLALAGALCMSVYTMIGSHCRKNTSTTVYTWLVYFAASLSVLAISIISRSPVVKSAPKNLLMALLLAIFCTLLGHSVFSWGLRYLPVAFISTAKLLEPVFAAIWGLILFQERPKIPVILGGIMIIAGVAIYGRTAEPLK